VKRKMKKIKIIILCNLLILLTTAFCAFCAEAIKPSVQVLPTTPRPGQPQMQAPSLPQVSRTPDNVYSYNPLGKPDPFKPFVDVQMTTAGKGKASKMESIFPLLRAEVESFKLVGIIGDPMRRVAVIEDSAKKVYPLFIGTRIGLHNGKVTDILADRVTVDELNGKKVKRIILKLRKNI
jgi:type IV pilus assembly protein PilP